MRKDVLLRLDYSGSHASLTEVWLETFDDAGNRIGLVQLHPGLNDADWLAMQRAAALVSHCGQLQAF
jgi:hypothetical protein